jgi:hypothetical protein
MMLISVMLCFAESTRAQAPQSIPYQAVARDASGNLLQNQPISVLFTITDLSSNGTVIYQEHQSATTNNFGLFTVNIGTGNPSGFDTIPWGNGNAKFIDIKIDAAHGLNGTGYTDLGASQMLSVPYALYAGSSGSVTGSITPISVANGGTAMDAANPYSILCGGTT